MSLRDISPARGGIPCATLMYAKGVQLKDMQLWLGHSTISTTSNIYTHLDFDSKVDSANAILGILTN